MPDHATIRSRIGDAREHLREKIDGVQRRIVHVRSYVANPWIQLGAALAVGYLLGCGEEAEPAIRAPRRHAPEPSKPETIVHAVVRAAAVTFVTSAIRRAVSGASAERADR